MAGQVCCCFHDTYGIGLPIIYCCPPGTSPSQHVSNCRVCKAANYHAFLTPSRAIRPSKCRLICCNIIICSPLLAVLSMSCCHLTVCPSSMHLLRSSWWLPRQQPQLYPLAGVWPPMEPLCSLAILRVTCTILNPAGAQCSAQEKSSKLSSNLSCHCLVNSMFICSCMHALSMHWYDKVLRALLPTRTKLRCT